MPDRSGPQGFSVCRDPRTRLISALVAERVAANEPVATQLVNKYFSSVVPLGRYSPSRSSCSFKDRAGMTVCPCCHQQSQQLPLQRAAETDELPRGLQIRRANGNYLRSISAAVQWVLEQVRLLRLILVTLVGTANISGPMMGSSCWGSVLLKLCAAARICGSQQQSLVHEAESVLSRSRLMCASRQQPTQSSGML